MKSQSKAPLLEVPVSKNLLDRYFGLCPGCGQGGEIVHIGRSEWAFCRRDGLKWRAGENLLSSWREETEEDWWQNFLFLERFQQTERWRPSPSLWERIVSRVHTWICSLRPRRSWPTDELPF